MVSIVLCFCLLIILNTTYQSKGGMVLSCSFISTFMFFIASVFYVFSVMPKAGDISFGTAAIIIASNLMILAGEMLFRNGRIKFNTGINIKNHTTIVNVSNIKAVFFALLTSAIMIAKIIYMRRLGMQFGIGSSLSAFTSAIRGSLTSGEVELPIALTFLSSISEGVAYVFSFLFLYYLILEKKRRLVLLLPVVFYLIMQLFSTGRSGFITFAVVFLCEIGFLIYNSSDGRSNRKQSGKFIKYAVIVVIAVAVMFYVYGNFVRSASHTMVEYIAEYIAAPILGLDNYLKDPWAPNQHFMQYIFQNYYYYLNKFGGNFYIPPTHLPFFSFGGLTSNIYTSLVFPIQDMGIIGLLISRVLIGMLYSILSYRACNMDLNYQRRNVFHVVITAYLLYAAVYSPIADKFRTIFTVTSFPLLILSVILCVNACTKKASTYDNSIA